MNKRNEIFEKMRRQLSTMPEADMLDEDSRADLVNCANVLIFHKSYRIVLSALKETSRRDPLSDPLPAAALHRRLALWPRQANATWRDFSIGEKIAVPNPIDATGVLKRQPCVSGADNSSRL